MECPIVILFGHVSQKSNKRSMAGTIKGETKREGQRKAKRHTAHKIQKKGKRANLSCGRKLCHPQPF
jgi:hypothetical protein